MPDPTGETLRGGATWMRPFVATGNRASAPEAGAVQKPFTRSRKRSTYPGTGLIFGKWAPEMTAESPDIVGRLSVRPAIRSFLHAKKKKFAGHERTIQLKLDLRMSPVQAQECSRDARRGGRFGRKDVCDDQRL